MTWNIALGSKLSTQGSPAGLHKAVRQHIETYDEPAESLGNLAYARAVGNEVCRDPASWMRSHPNRESDLHLRFFKWVINLIDFCAGMADAGDLTAVQALLSGHDFGKRFLLNAELVHRGDAEEKRRVLAMLADAAKYQGVFTLSADASTLRLRSPSELGIIFLSGYDVVRGVFSTVGRAVGLAIQTGCTVGSLRLAPALVELLHPRIRARTSWQNVKSAIIQLGVPDADVVGFVQSIRGFSQAIAQGLNPGGLSLISNEEWRRLFAVSE